MLPNTQSTFLAQGIDFILKILKYLLTETIYSGFVVMNILKADNNYRTQKDLQMQQNSELKLSWTHLNAQKFNLTSSNSLRRWDPRSVSYH